MRKGFSLLELLVCTAIIAALGALSAPVFVEVRQKGKQTASLANLKELHVALMIYRADYPGTEQGTAEQMGLPGWSNPKALFAIYDRSGWKGRSSCGFNSTVSPDIAADKIRYPLFTIRFGKAPLESFPDQKRIGRRRLGSRAKQLGFSTILIVTSP
ncbi:prepilin-type N-terminal cleavage/methylation domain-containing protein [bacterium]|nr:MAG: prepilin-type N-terminal cleavage/methylation domain-containing protein [bacterium]